MTANNDILLGYFDSLLTPEPTESFVDQDSLSNMLAAVTDAPMADVYVAPLMSDTIATGFRLIPLMTPPTTTIMTTIMTTALSLTMTFELLSLAAKLGRGRIKTHVMVACAGVIADG